MAAWEYQLYVFDIDQQSDDSYSEQMIEQLNDWGNQGWEAVSLITMEGQKRPSGTLLKRQKN